LPQTDETKILQLLLREETRREGFAMLVDQYSEMLYWKIRGMVLSHDDADDILQNTFLKAWRSIGEFQGKSKLSTWLYRIAINESLDFIRHQKSQQAVRTDVDVSVANSLMSDSYFDGDRTHALLEEAVASLPEVQRTVFNMRYFDEMKYAEISSVLGTSEGALKASYHIAVQKVSDYVRRHADSD
jgi:RNA polymerase sigma factor (sigma-70 family)